MRYSVITLLLAVLVWIATSSSARADEGASPRPDAIIQRVGFTEDQFPGTATRDAEIAIDYWFQIISDRNRSAHIANTTVFNTFDQMRQALLRKRLDIVAILSLDFLRVRDEIELEPFSVATRGEDAYVEYAIYVRKDSGIADIGQLASQRIIFDGSDGAELGRFWFETALLRKGHDPFDYMHDTESVDKASRAILPVYFDQAAACIATRRSFDNMREMNPRLGADLIALETSPPLLSGVVCFTTEIDPADKPDIAHTLLTLHEDPQGQQVLNLFRRDRTVPYDPEQLQSLLALVEERRELEAERNIASPLP